MCSGRLLPGYVPAQDVLPASLSAAYLPSPHVPPRDLLSLLLSLV